MINFKKLNIIETPWKIIFSASLLSFIGLVALSSISYQSPSIVQNPFFKQLFFLIFAFGGFLIAFLTPKYLIHKYAYVIYSLGIVLVILPFFGATHAGTYRWLNIGLITLLSK